MMHFYLMTYSHALVQKTFLWGPEIYNFGRPYLIYHNHTLSFSDLCLEVEKKISKENNAFLLSD